MAIEDSHLQIENLVADHRGLVVDQNQEVVVGGWSGVATGTGAEQPEATEMGAKPVFELFGQSL